jgi:tetratricopeptide (TPR) repeat protein
MKLHRLFCILFVFLTASLTTEAANPPMAAQVFRETLNRFSRTHDKTEAAAGFHKSADLDPNYQAPRYNLGILAEAQEDWESAAKWFKSVIEIDAASEFGRKSTERLKNVQRSTQLFKSEEGRRQIAFEQSLARARALLAADRLVAANTEAEKAAQLQPDRYEPLTILADIADKNGRFDRAKEYLNKVKELAPYEKRTAIDKALSEVERNSNFEAFVTAGKKAMESGDYATAARSFRDAVAQKPWREEYSLRQGLALMLGEEFSNARNVLRPLTTSKRPEVAREAAVLLKSIQDVEEKLAATRLAARNLEATAKAYEPWKKEMSISNELTDSDLRMVGIYCDGIPDRVRKELYRLVKAGQKIKSVSLSATGGFVIVYGKNDFIENGTTALLRQKLNEARDGGEEIRRLLMGADGSWLLLKGNGAWYCNAPQVFIDRMHEMDNQKQNVEAGSFTFQGGYYVVHNTYGYSYNNIPQNLSDLAKDLYDKKTAVTHVAFAPNGAWCVIVGTNGFWYAGTPDKLQAALNRVNSDNATVNVLAFGPNESWVVVASK